MRAGIAMETSRRRPAGFADSKDRGGLKPAATRWVVAVERFVVAGLSPLAGALLVAGVLVVSGCRQDMHDQAKYKPYRSSEFFADGRASRQLPPDTVARGQLREDTLLYTGKVDGQLTTELPRAVSAENVKRGQERYNIYCSPCHDRVGSGNGMIVQRGYRRPPSFHDPRLRQQSAGYFFDVISNGFGVMPNYAQQIPVDDRWAIVSYIRALQLSQNATLADVPAADRPQLNGVAKAPAAAAAGAHHE